MMSRGTKPGQERRSGAGEDAPSDIRERIPDRTIYLMGKRGTTDVPVRAIAKEASVNVAAVNYYFSSKEQMLTRLADRFQSGFEEVMTLLEAQDQPPAARLRRWSLEVMRYLVEYPGILVLMERQIAAEPLDPFGKALRAAMEHAADLLKSTLKELLVGTDEQRLAFKLSLFISALAGPFPRPRDRDEAQPGFGTTTQRESFFNLLLEHLHA